MFSRTFRSRYRAFVLRVRRKQPYHKEKYLPCREGRSAREGRPCHLLEGLRAQREEWAGAGRGRVRQGDNAGGMGTFSLTPERGGGRRLSQRPGRRKELAKQARKDRKKESKAICCQSIVKKVFQEAPTLEDKQNCDVRNAKESKQLLTTRIRFLNLKKRSSLEKARHYQERKVL